MNATVTTAIASSPRRCASTARTRPAPVTSRAATTHNTVAPVVSPKVRSATPRNDWFATNAGPVAAATRDESRNSACSQKALDSRGATTQPARAITTKVPAATAAARKRRVSSRYTTKIPGTSLQAAATPMPTPLHRFRSGNARSATTSSISTALTCPRPRFELTGSSHNASPVTAPATPIRPATPR